MKANEILNILGINKPNKSDKAHAAKLSEIFGLMKSFKPVDFLEVKIQPCPNFTFGSYSTEGNRWNKPEQIQSDFKTDAMRVTVKTLTGSYSQNIPTKPDIYLPFLRLFPSILIAQPTEVKETKKADFELYFNEVQTKVIKAAAKFCSKDIFKPAQNCVFIEVKDNRVNVAATDGHKLFSESFNDIGLLPEGIFLIPVKNLTSVKKDLMIEFFKGEHNIETGKINGLNFDYCNEPFPNYMNVWPKYDKFVECDRKELINAVKCQLPFANKTTHQIKFHFNGSIAINAKDLDFNNESGVKISYSDKTTPDFEIAFNGKFLIESLSALQSQKVKIYSDGKPSKAVILNDSVLLMPVMLNQYL